MGTGTNVESVNLTEDITVKTHFFSNTEITRPDRLASFQTKKKQTMQLRVLNTETDFQDALAKFIYCGYSSIEGFAKGYDYLNLTHTAELSLSLFDKAEEVLRHLLAAKAIPWMTKIDDVTKREDFVRKGGHHITKIHLDPPSDSVNFWTSKSANASRLKVLMFLIPPQKPFPKCQNTTLEKTAHLYEEFDPHSRDTARNPIFEHFQLWQHAVAYDGGAVFIPNVLPHAGALLEKIDGKYALHANVLTSDGKNALQENALGDRLVTSTERRFKQFNERLRSDVLPGVFGTLTNLKYLTVVER